VYAVLTERRTDHGFCHQTLALIELTMAIAVSAHFFLKRKLRAACVIFPKQNG
jgi:hypothetical protein